MELTKENVALLAACGVLIGTVISNVITFLIHSSKQKNEWIKENKKKKIEKGEELYKNLVIWKKSVFVIQNDWVLLARGHLTLEAVNNKAIVRSTEHPEFGKISEVSSILAGIYFPDVAVQIKRAQEKLKPANEIYFSFAKGRKLEDKELAVKTIHNSGRDFDNYVDKILEDISQQIIKMMEK